MKPSLYITMICAAAALPAGAQQLSTEVVVDRTVVPAERPATRLSGLTPVLVLPQPAAPNLSQSYYTGLSAVTRSYSRLDPAYGAAAAERSPYRGYVDLGYFPLLNAGATAGYRFVDNDKLTVGACAMLHGERFKPLKDDDHNQQMWNADVAAGLAWRPKRGSELSARASYTYLRQNTPEWQPANLNAGSAELGWRSEAGEVEYRVDASVALESTGDTKFNTLYVGSEPRLFLGLSQQEYRFGAEASLPVAPGSRAGIEAEGDYVHTSGNDAGLEATTFGSLGIKPFYSLEVSNFAARVGVKVEFATGGEGSKVHVAPDLRLQWSASSTVGLWAEAGGGDVVNSFARLRQNSPYQLFAMPCGRSDIPVVVEGGLNVGPFKGFTAGIYGGYAKANEWLLYAEDDLVNPYRAVNINGWHAGVRLGAEWGIVKASVQTEAAPGSYDRAWLRNPDRARYTLNANVEVRPIDRLTVGAGYELRACRSYYDGYDKMNLGNVSNLNLRASYDVTAAVTIFANVENLLGRRCTVLPYVESKKTAGLVGVAFKF